MSDEDKLDLPNQDDDMPIDDSMMLEDNDENDAALAPMLASDKADEPLQAIYDVPVQVSAVLGKASMQVSQLLKLGRGAVVELDRRVGDAIDVYVNDRLVARGEVIIVDDHLGVTMTEIIKSDKA